MGYRKAAYWWDIRISPAIFWVRLIFLTINAFAIAFYAAFLICSTGFVCDVVGNAGISPMILHPDQCAGFGFLGEIMFVVAILFVYTLGMNITGLFDHIGQGFTHKLTDTVCLLATATAAAAILVFPQYTLTQRIDDQFERQQATANKTLVELSQSVPTDAGSDAIEWHEKNASTILSMQQISSTQVMPLTHSEAVTLFSTFVLPLIIWIFFKAMNEVGSRSYRKQQTRKRKQAIVVGRHNQLLLSHRALGFNRPEGSLSALRAFIESPIRSVEIDTRCTTDGELLVLHDPNLQGITNRTGLVSEYSVARQGRPSYKEDESAEHVPTFAELAREFASRREERNRQLYVDIKDVGHEKEHFEILEMHGLLDCATIISWHPQVLLNFHRLCDEAKQVPLVFGYYHLINSLHPLALIARSKLLCKLLKYAASISSKNRRLLNISASAFYDTCQLTDKDGKGKNHVCVLKNVDSPELIKVLSDSGGGVGTFADLLGDNLRTFAHEHGLNLFVFSCDSFDEFVHIADQYSPKVIFSDDPMTFKFSAVRSESESGKLASDLIEELKSVVYDKLGLSGNAT